MGKLPTFPFYASDFLVDTSEWTDQEVGVYIRLLANQWVNGDLSPDPNRLATITPGAPVVWDHIKHKFILNEKGRLVNRRLEDVRQEKLAFIGRQKVNGKLGGRPGKKAKDNPGHNPEETQAFEKQNVSLSKTEPTQNPNKSPRDEEEREDVSGINNSSNSNYSLLNQVPDPAWQLANRIITNEQQLEIIQLQFKDLSDLKKLIQKWSNWFITKYDNWESKSDVQLVSSLRNYLIKAREFKGPEATFYIVSGQRVEVDPGTPAPPAEGDPGFRKWYQKYVVDPALDRAHDTG